MKVLASTKILIPTLQLSHMSSSDRQELYKRLRRSLFTGPIFQAIHRNEASKLDDVENIDDLLEFIGSRLDSQVHQLFRKTAFSNVNAIDERTISFFHRPITDEFYGRMVPALHLASLFLEHSKPFLMMLRYADLEGDANKTRYGRLHLDPDYKPTEEQEAGFEAELAAMAERIQICWHDPGKSTCGEVSHGVTNIIQLRELRDASDDMVIRISFHHKLWHIFSSPKFQQKSWEHKYAVWLNVAVILMHELCHAIFWWRQRQEVRAYLTNETVTTPDSSDPEIKPFTARELGFTWEMLYFRGFMWMGGSTMMCPNCQQLVVSERYDGSYGTVLHRKTFGYKSLGKKSIIPYSTLYKFFQESTWPAGPEEERKKIAMNYLQNNHYYRPDLKSMKPVLDTRRTSGSTDISLFKDVHSPGNDKPNPCPYLENSPAILQKAIYDGSLVSADYHFGRPSKLVNNSEMHLNEHLMAHWNIDGRMWANVDIDTNSYLSHCTTRQDDTSSASSSPDAREPYSSNSPETDEQTDQEAAMRSIYANEPPAGAILSDQTEATHAQTPSEPPAVATLVDRTETTHANSPSPNDESRGKKGERKRSSDSIADDNEPSGATNSPSKRPKRSTSTDEALAADDQLSEHM